MTEIGKIPVAILGATGSVGQRLVTLLEDHPWFELAAVTASERSVGRPYGEAVRWVQAIPLASRIARLPVVPTEPGLPCSVVFSALDAAVAGPAEQAFAREGVLVVSNAKSHRMHPRVPLVVPEVNPDHLELTRCQAFGGGAIVTNPNCSTIGLVLALKPLFDAFGIERLQVVTLQAVSGAGLTGLSGLETVDNVIPFIGGEEEKLERETRKILGSLHDERVEDADLRISAQCNRVPVLDGHTECVSLSLSGRASPEDLRAAWEEFVGEPQRRRLPTAPPKPIYYLEGDRVPQPRLHRDLGGGMAVSVGRLRPCSVLDYKFVVLSHNTIRGAAGGALLLAELAIARGIVEGIEGGIGR